MEEFTLLDRATGQVVRHYTKSDLKQFAKSMPKEEFRSKYAVVPKTQETAPVQPTPAPQPQPTPQPAPAPIQEQVPQPVPEENLLPDTTMTGDYTQSVSTGVQRQNQVEIQREDAFKTVDSIIKDSGALQNPIAYGEALKYAESIPDEELSEEVQLAVKKKWNQTGGRDYQIGTTSSVNPMPLQKSDTIKAVENIFTTEAMDEGSVLKSIFGVLGAPARALGSLSGKGEMSDEETLLLRDSIEKNQEILQNIIETQEPTITRQLNVLGLSVVDFMMRVVSDPLSYVDVLGGFSKAGGKAGAKKLSLSEDTLKRLRPDLTDEQVRRAIDLKGSTPTRAEKRAMSKVYTQQEVNVGRGGGAKEYMFGGEGADNYSETLSGRQPTKSTKIVNEMLDMASQKGEKVNVTRELRFLNEEIPMKQGAGSTMNNVRSSVNDIAKQITSIDSELKQARLELGSANLEAQNARKMVAIKGLENKLINLVKEEKIEEIYQSVKSGTASSRSLRKTLADTKKRVADAVKETRDEIKKLSLEKEQLSINKAKAGTKEGKQLVEGQIINKRQEILNQKTAPETESLIQNKESVKAGEQGLSKATDQTNIARQNLDVAKSEKRLDDFTQKKTQIGQKMELVQNSEVEEAKGIIQRLKERKSDYESQSLQDMEKAIIESGKMTLSEAKKFIGDMYDYLRKQNFYDPKNPASDDLNLKKISEYVSKVRDKILEKGREIYGEEFVDVWKAHAKEVEIASNADKVLKIRSSEVPNKTLASILKDISSKSGSEINENILEIKDYINALKNVDEAYGTSHFDDFKEAHRVKNLFKEDRGRLYFNVSLPKRDGGGWVAYILGELKTAVVNTVKFSLAETISLTNKASFGKISPNFLRDVVQLTEGGDFIRRSLQVQDTILDFGKKLTKILSGYSPRSPEYKFAKNMMLNFSKAFYSYENATMSNEEYKFLKENLPRNLGYGIDQPETQNMQETTDNASRGIMQMAGDLFEGAKSLITDAENKTKEAIKTVQDAKDKFIINEMDLQKVEALAQMGKVIFDDAKENGVEKTLKKLGIESENVSNYSENVMIPYVAKMLKDNAFDGYNFVLTSLKREKLATGKGKNSEHPNGRALDIRGLSADGRAFHPRAKFNKIVRGNKTIYEPDAETKTMIDEVISNIQKVPFVNKVKFEKEYTGTYKAEDFMPHFHIEIEDVGLKETEVNAIVDLLGKKLKVGIKRNNFGGDSEVTGVSVE